MNVVTRGAGATPYSHQLGSVHAMLRRNWRIALIIIMIAIAGTALTLFIQAGSWEDADPIASTLGFFLGFAGFILGVTTLLLQISANRSTQQQAPQETTPPPSPHQRPLRKIRWILRLGAPTTAAGGAGGCLIDMALGATVLSTTPAMLLALTVPSHRSTHNPDHGAPRFPKVAHIKEGPSEITLGPGERLTFDRGLAHVRPPEPSWTGDLVNRDGQLVILDAWGATAGTRTSLRGFPVAGPEDCAGWRLPFTGPALPPGERTTICYISYSGTKWVGVPWVLRTATAFVAVISVESLPKDRGLHLRILYYS